jgi:hypothetical protein
LYLLALIPYAQDHDHKEYKAKDMPTAEDWGEINAKACAAGDEMKRKMWWCGGATKY